VDVQFGIHGPKYKTDDSEFKSSGPPALDWPCRSLSNLYSSAPVHGYLGVVPHKTSKEKNMDRVNKHMSPITLPLLDAAQPVEFHTATFGMG
jgi:hypothetical protein